MGAGPDNLMDLPGIKLRISGFAALECDSMPSTPPGSAVILDQEPHDDVGFLIQNDEKLGGNAARVAGAIRPKSKDRRPMRTAGPSLGGVVVQDLCRRPRWSDDTAAKYD